MPARPLIFSGRRCERCHENKKRIQMLTIFCFLMRGFWHPKKAGFSTATARSFHGYSCG
jgi:hypothetical protein